MGWLIAFGVLVLLAILPLGVSARYDAAGPAVRLIAGPGRLLLYPRKKKENRADNPAKGSHDPKEKTGEIGRSTRKSPNVTADSPEHAGGSWTDFLPLVKTGLNLLRSFRRKLRVNKLELRLIMAGGDPCNLAVNYGRAWAAVGGLLPNLERAFVIQERNIAVECDFSAEKTTVRFQMDLTITLGRLLGLVVVYGLRVLWNFMQIKKKRKGGAFE